jgi:hypothetical protein
MTTSDNMDLEAPPFEADSEQPNTADVGEASEAEARTIIERLLPDLDQRGLFLAVLADSILAAHTAGPNKWGLTLYYNRIWLNVGRIVVCSIERDTSWVAIDTRLLHDRERLDSEDLIFNSWKSLPHSAALRLTSATDPAILESNKAAHAALIKQAADAVKQVRGPTAQAHSSGTMAYLRATLQRSLPDPEYIGRLPDIDRPTIEQAFRDFDSQKRGQSYWANWESDPTYRYAVLWEDRRYPVKEIVRMATGVERFHSVQAREYLQKRNFTVVSLRQAPGPNGGPSSLNVRDLLHQQLTSRGLHFTVWQIATFYTALQAKGFVILSGISGTGKTKLAQHFAELLPQPGAAAVPVEREDERIVITLKPYMFKYNRLIIPKQATRFFDPPKPGESKDVELTFDDQSQVCRLTHAEYSDTDYVALMLRGSAVKWFKQTFKPDDTLTLEPEFDAKQDLVGFHLADGAHTSTGVPPPSQGSKAQPDIAQGTAPATTSEEAGANWLFIPVRPDWRDSKSLLGYFNPLTGTYVWTDFLRFLVRAAQSYRNREDLAWFVILDEMNLARVEYYFADLLSVLESGRTSEGWSREALRLDYPTTSDGDLPPRELRLPPSLAFIGTVNVDETTHAFSPKVLDRAFTIEFVEADFAAYPPVAMTAVPSLTPQLQQDILQQFSQNGQFQRVAKDRIAAYVAAHPEVRDHLQSLNTLLQPYSMHFGFRVFDEIVSFLAAADENALFDDLGDARAAFDAAVLMKVLPKFHGSRGKLEAPLRAVLAWCVNPTAPDIAPIASKLDQCESGQAAMQALSQLTYQYERTAARVARMVWALYTDGFASFG